MQNIVDDMVTKNFSQSVFDEFGIDIFKTDKDNLPENQSELELHMQLDYKDSIENFFCSGLYFFRYDFTFSTSPGKS